MANLSSSYFVPNFLITLKHLKEQGTVDLKKQIQNKSVNICKIVCLSQHKHCYGVIASVILSLK